MADFNPDTGLNPDGQSMLGYAGNAAQGNKAMATLFGGATDALTEAAGSVDTQNLFDIKSDVQDNLDKVNKQFGYDADSVPATVGAPTNTPPELSGAAAQLNKLAAAKAQGKLTDSHYWALLQSNVKDLKAKYAGYSDNIDQIVQQTTGQVPANALRASIDAYNQKLAGAADDLTKQQNNFLMDHMDYAQQIMGGTFNPNDPRMQEPAFRGKLIGAVGNLQAKDQQYKSSNLQLENADKNNAQVQQQAQNVFTQNVNSTVQTTLTGLALNSGVATPGEDAFQAMARIAGSSNPDPNKLVAIQSALNAAKADAQARINKMKLTGAGNILDAPKQQAIIDASMKTFDDLQNFMSNKDYGGLARYTRMNEFGASQDLSSILAQNPIAREMQAIQKIAPQMSPDFAAKQYPQLMGAMDQWRQGINNGIRTPDDQKAAMDADKNLNNSQKGEVITESIKQLAQTNANPSTPNETVIKNVNNITKGGLDQTYAAIANKGDVLNTLLRPETVDRVASASPQAAKDLAQWAFSKAQGVPEVRAMAAQIGGSDNVRGGMTAGYVYNPKTYQFLPAPPSAQTNIAPDVYENQRQAAEVTLQPFNRMIGNLAHSMKAAGIDPNDPNNPGSLPAFLKQVGAGMGSAGNVDALQSALTAHSDSTAQPQPEQPIEKTPTFEFLSDPQTADGFKTGENGDIKSVIRQGEAGKSGYDASIGDGGTPRVAFSKMTVSQVLQAQSQLPNSKAVGGYQFIPSTLHYAIDKAGIKLSDKFDEATQDKLADVLMEDAGYSRWKSGKLSDYDFQNNLAQIWAGVPETSGMSHYQGVNGNKATVSVNDVQSAIKRTKKS